jgi:hypothetical protein
MQSCLMRVCHPVASQPSSGQDQPSTQVARPGKFKESNGPSGGRDRQVSLSQAMLPPQLQARPSTLAISCRHWQCPIQSRTHRTLMVAGGPAYRPVHEDPVGVVCKDPRAPPHREWCHQKPQLPLLIQRAMASVDCLWGARMDPRDFRGRAAISRGVVRGFIQFVEMLFGHGYVRLSNSR